MAGNTPPTLSLEGISAYAQPLLVEWLNLSSQLIQAMMGIWTYDPLFRGNWYIPFTCTTTTTWNYFNNCQALFPHLLQAENCRSEFETMQKGRQIANSNLIYNPPNMGSHFSVECLPLPLYARWHWLAENEWLEQLSTFSLTSFSYRYFLCRPILP